MISKDTKQELRKIAALKRGHWKAYEKDGKVFVFEVTKPHGGERFGHTYEVNFNERTLTPCT